MTIETVTYISDLNIALPGASDVKSEGDDHVRNIKKAIKATFPNFSGACTPTHTVINNLAAGTFPTVPLTGITTLTASGTITAPTFSGNATSATTAASCSGNAATATTASACSGNSATASSVAWTGVSGRPTDLSSFTNGPGYYASGSAATHSTVTVSNAGGLTVGGLMAGNDPGSTWGSIPVGGIATGSRVGAGSSFAIGGSMACNGTNYFATMGTDGVGVNVQYGTWRCLGSVNSTYCVWLRIA